MRQEPDMAPPRAADAMARYLLRRKLVEGQARLRVQDLEDLSERLMAELLARAAQIERLQRALRCTGDIRWLARRAKRPQAEVLTLIERLMNLTSTELDALFQRLETP